MTDQYAADLDELIKRAQKEPGIVDLLGVYGQYREVLEKSRQYLAGMLPKTNISTTAGTS